MYVEKNFDKFLNHGEKSCLRAMFKQVEINPHQKVCTQQTIHNEISHLPFIAFHKSFRKDLHWSPTRFAKRKTRFRPLLSHNNCPSDASFFTRANLVPRARAFQVSGDWTLMDSGTIHYRKHDFVLPVFGAHARTFAHWACAETICACALRVMVRFVRKAFYKFTVRFLLF